MTSCRTLAWVTVIIAITASSAATAQSPAAPRQAGAPAQSGAPQTSPAPQQTPAPGSSDVYTPGRGVLAPRVVAEVKPTYTAEAMRNRVQGTVTLRGIVERDGTISSIEVLNSLDKMYGLDQAAIDALKQWRFQPGTVEGNPVRVLVNVELTFAIRDRPPSQAWPAGFIVITGGPTADETAESDGVRVTVARPATWTRRSAAATEWLVLRAADGVSTVSAIRPENAAFELRAPAADPLVSRVAESVRRGQPVADAEILGTGQIQSANVFWVWTALRLPRLPASSSAADAERFAEARTWVFIATVNGKVFGVSCTLPIPRGLEPAAIDELVRKAGATFGPIVNSVRIQQVQ